MLSFAENLILETCRKILSVTKDSIAGGDETILFAIHSLLLELPFTGMTWGQAENKAKKIKVRTSIASPVYKLNELHEVSKCLFDGKSNFELARPILQGLNMNTIVREHNLLFFGDERYPGSLPAGNNYTKDFIFMIVPSAAYAYANKAIEISKNWS